MPIIKSTINWVKMDPARGTHYENKKTNPEKWSLQVQTADKAESSDWAKKFGIRMSPKEVDGALVYTGSISAYARNQEGELNKPLVSILNNGQPVDPNTVGNGSVANVMFRVREDGDKKFTRLQGIQVIKHVVYKSEEESFELSDDVEIVEDSGGEVEDSLY